MPFYVQHTPEGLITGTVMTDVAPEHTHQIELKEWTDTANMMVAEGKLVPAPIKPEETQI